MTKTVIEVTIYFSFILALLLYAHMSKRELDKLAREKRLKGYKPGDHVSNSCCGRGECEDKDNE